MVQFTAGMTTGLGRIVRGDAKAFMTVPEQAVVRAGRGARSSLRRQIRAIFKRHKALGGKAFPDTLPPIRPKLEDVGNGKRGVRVRTKAWFRHRRSRGFDLFWLFDNAPMQITSGRGRMLAVPLPNAKLPLAGRGATRKLPWPRDLMNLGWKLSIIPAGRGGLKSPLIVGGPPGTRRKDWKALYTLHPGVTIRKRLNLKATADRFAKRIAVYEQQAYARAVRRVSAPRSIAA